MRIVASGPFGNAMLSGGMPAVWIGTAVHYAIMIVMVAVFVYAAHRLQWLVAHPMLAGTLYGLGLYFVMYCIVLPARWPGLYPELDAWSLGTALFGEIACVGIPLAFIVGIAVRHEQSLRGRAGPV